MRGRAPYRVFIGDIYRKKRLTFARFGRLYIEAEGIRRNGWRTDNRRGKVATGVVDFGWRSYRNRYRNIIYRSTFSLSPLFAKFFILSVLFFRLFYRERTRRYCVYMLTASHFLLFIEYIHTQTIWLKKMSCPRQFWFTTSAFSILSCVDRAKDNFSHYQSISVDIFCQTIYLKKKSIISSWFREAYSGNERMKITRNNKTKQNKTKSLKYTTSQIAVQNKPIFNHDI